MSIRPEARFERAEDFQSALTALLPQGYVADRALAAFLARHFNVDRERRQLAEDIARASEFLASTGERASAQGSAGSSAVGGCQTAPSGTPRC